MVQEAGLFVQGNGEEDEVPLRELSVRAFLQGAVVGFRSKLSYENKSKDPVEVLFRTPVDDSYAVVGLEAIIDGRTIRADLQDKAKAREMYEEALSSGRTAALGEEKKGDIFSVALGNLAAGKQAELRLIMVGELAVDPDGAVRFVLPTVLKPRYTPAGGTDPLAPAPPQGEKSVKQALGPVTYTFELNISGASEVARVTSPSHEITQENNGQVIKIGVVEDTPKDVVILVHPAEPHKPQVIIEPGFSDGKNDFQKSTAVMLSFFPEFKGDGSCTQAACEFVFVVDRSGSMGGDGIRDAAQTLILFLKSIPEGCYFNVVGFGSSYEKLFPESVPYNQKNMEVAVQHAKHLQADLGGTEIFDPLKEIFSHSQMKGLPRQVFVLTDGSVSNTESVIKLVANNSHKARCFSFGIGSGASTSLVKGIAAAGKGTAEFITHGERMQPKVIRSLKKAMQAAVADVKVKFNLPKEFAVQVAPENLPPIFIGERTIVYGIIKSSSDVKDLPSKLIQGSVCLSGDLLGAKIEHTLKVEIPSGVVVARNEQRVATIHHLAAKRLIKDMETGNSTPKQTIIQLSLDSSVISTFTSFIAVDESKQPVQGSLQTWDVISPYVHSSYGNVQSFYFTESSLCGMQQESAPLDVFSGPHPPPGYALHSASKCSKKSMAKPSRPAKLKSTKRAVRENSPPLKTADSSEEYCAEMCLGDYYCPIATEDIVRMCAYSGVPSRSSNSIIDLQLASGAWNLTREFAVFLGKSEDALNSSCPMQPCQGNIQSVWATIIALSYLQVKQANLKDEWELVAAKANAWLAEQALPEGCSIEALRQSALNVI